MRPIVETTTPTRGAVAGDESYFTVFVGGEIFGLPVARTQTVFRIASVTPVPFAHPDIAGLVNLRGRIVTAVSLRRRLKMPADAGANQSLAIGIEHRSENFALIVDQVGDVLVVTKSMEIPVPPHFDPERSRLTTTLYRIGRLLIPALNIEAIFDFDKS